MQILIPEDKQVDFIDLVEWYIPLRTGFEEGSLEQLELSEDQYCKARDYLADFLIELVVAQLKNFGELNKCEKS